MASAALAPTTVVELLTGRAADAGEAAEARQQQFSAAGCRSPAHRRAPTADRVSSGPGGGYVTAKRWASSRMRCSRRNAGLPRGNAMASAESRVKTSSSCLARPMATACRGRRRAARRRRPTAGPCRRRSRRGLERDRPIRGPAIARRRPRASTRSRRGCAATAGFPAGASARPARAVGSGTSRPAAMRNLRYSLRRMRPSSQTTIEATVSLPWMVEMSKHSMRRGSAAGPGDPQRVERLGVLQRPVVGPRVIRERGVPDRQIEQAAFLAASRHDELTLRPARDASQSSSSAVIGQSHRHVDLGRRIVRLIELRQRRVEDVGLARRLDAPSAAVHNSTRSTTRPPRTWKT